MITLRNHAPRYLCTELKNHPNQKFASDLLNDLQWGCRLGYTGPRAPRVTPNLKSATLHPQAVSDALAKEVSRGHTATAFESGQLQQQPRLAYLPGSFRLLVDGPAIALLFTSGLLRLFFRKYQAC